MKSKLSVSIDGNLIKVIETLIGTGRFRNKSHVLEYALRKYVEGKNE